MPGRRQNDRQRVDKVEPAAYYRVGTPKASPRGLLCLGLHTHWVRSRFVSSSPAPEIAPTDRRSTLLPAGPSLLSDVVVPGRAEGEQSTISLVRELCNALEAEGVSYCHWKSNAFLDRSRKAENDLDLLVRRADSDPLSATAHRLGFKQADNPARSLPGVSNFYGYDKASDRLVHIHAHYQLIVGDDLTKNYRIPLEEAFLEAAVHDGEFRIPPRELELIVLVIRIVLKHSTWDAVLARRAKVPASAREELAFLQTRVDEDLVYRMLQQHLPFVERRSFDDCLRSVDPRFGTLGRIRAGQRLAGELAGCARRSRAADIRLKLWRRGVGIVHRLLSTPAPRKRLSTGGAMIAVVGADGAGKSTVVDGLCTWLSKDFAVTKVHLGKPPRSWTTVAITAVAKLRLALVAVLGRRSSLRDGRTASSPSKLRMLLAVATARDRYTLYRKGRRIASNGGLVICDRFPLPQLTLMDAPRVERTIAPGIRTPLARRLASAERRYYQALTLPDVLIVLRVDPEIAVARKPEEPPDFVRARWRDIWEVDWQAVPAHVVDASRSAADVLSEVKALVWAEL
jgi:thymidylate kinase